MSFQMKPRNPAMIITTNRTSAAVGLAMVGLASFVSIITVWRWKVLPWWKKSNRDHAEASANFVFEREQATKEEADRNRFY